MDNIEITETQEAMIKSIIDMQQRQEKIISELNNTVNTIQHSMMNDKKYILENEINQCLNQGYATFEQNKKITSDYLDYTQLKGNGEIKELYEQHYLKLQVHERI